MAERKTFYVIDGSSYLYRAFYAIQKLTNARGTPTQAVYGFAQMLAKVLRDHSPDYVCMVFDAPGPTFRHEIYDQYKATRERMPEDLAVQVPYIKKLVELHGVPQVEREGFEADDIIATLTDRAAEQGLEVVVVSGDKDLHQLVRDPLVIQWDPQRDRTFTEREVEEHFGVRPERMIDMQALMGDSSDNVPGVPGVGEKTAKKLLSQFETLEDLYENIEKVSAKGVRKKLEDNRDKAFLSRQLVTLRHDVPLERTPSDFQPLELRRAELLQLYEDLGFKNFIQNLKKEMKEAGELDAEEDAGENGEGSEANGDVPASPYASVEREVVIVRDEETFSALLTDLGRQERFSVDLETTSQEAMRADVVGVALSIANYKGYYIPVAHTGEGNAPQLDAKRVLDGLKPLLTAPAPLKIGQNLKYEWVVFKRHGIDLKGIGFDTMVASYLLAPGNRTHKLERITGEHLGESMISYADVAGKGKDHIGFAAVEVKRAAEYAAEDAEVVWRLTPLLERKLKEIGLLDLYTTLELPLVEVLAAMEYAGIRLDAEQLRELSIDLQKLLDQRADRVHELAGEEFNIQSPKQLGGILFDKLKLPIIKKTKTGPSTDVSVLETLAIDHPIAEEVLAYRSLAKLKGTYVDALPELIHPETGRIHTSFNQTVTATGRLSSSDPNLQNIPIRTEEGRKIRLAFIPADGCVLLAADYSQIELRILAHCSEDPALLDAFHEGADIHRRTAAEMYGVNPIDVSPGMRRQAKAINFGIIYGISPFGLSKQLRISQTEAKANIERYFERYTGVRTFIEHTIQETRERGYSVTLLGRRRPIPELASRNKNIRQQGERLAVNTTIQGTAADLIKKAMIDLHAVLPESAPGSKMLLQVHDELVFEVPEQEFETMQALVRDKMENVLELKVPLKVDMGSGSNWVEAHG